MREPGNQQPLPLSAANVGLSATVTPTPQLWPLADNVSIADGLSTARPDNS